MSFIISKRIRKGISVDYRNRQLPDRILADSPDSHQGPSSK